MAGVDGAREKVMFVAHSSTRFHFKKRNACEDKKKRKEGFSGIFICYLRIILFHISQLWEIVVSIGRLNDGRKKTNTKKGMSDERMMNYEYRYEGTTISACCHSMYYYS